MSVLYCTVMYQVKYSTVVHRKVPIIKGPMLGLNYSKNLLQAMKLMLLSIYKVVAKRNSNIIKFINIRVILIGEQTITLQSKCFLLYFEKYIVV